MQLCIDWGNTRVKAALFQENKLVKDFNFSEEEALTRLMDIVDTEHPQSAILSSVAHHPPELKVLLQEKTRLLVLNAQTPVPVMNAYHSPDTLGPDRLALAIGANSVYPDANNLVISIGTAITYNFIHQNKTFRGGNITPGMEMRFRALNEYTDKLPLVGAEGEVILLGYDTETSIRGGVVLGIIAELEGMINFYGEQYPGLNIVLTGGNAPIFAGKLKNRIFADSQLLLKGLNTILRYNVR